MLGSCEYQFRQFSWPLGYRTHRSEAGVARYPWLGPAQRAIGTVSTTLSCSLPILGTAASASSLGPAPEFSSRPIFSVIRAMVRGIILEFTGNSVATLRHRATMHSCCSAAGLGCRRPQASASLADPGQLESAISPARSCSLRAKRQPAVCDDVETN